MKAAGRINKLRQLTVIGFSVVLGVGFGGYGVLYVSGQFNIATATIVVIITMGIYFPIAAYLVRKWSKEWNKKFLR